MSTSRTTCSSGRSRARRGRARVRPGCSPKGGSRCNSRMRRVQVPRAARYLVIVVILVIAATLAYAIVGSRRAGSRPHSARPPTGRSRSRHPTATSPRSIRRPASPGRSSAARSRSLPGVLARRDQDRLRSSGDRGRRGVRRRRVRAAVRSASRANRSRSRDASPGRPTARRSRSCQLTTSGSPTRTAPGRTSSISTSPPWPSSRGVHRTGESSSSSGRGTARPSCTW